MNKEEILKEQITGKVFTHFKQSEDLLNIKVVREKQWSFNSSSSYVLYHLFSSGFRDHGNAKNLLNGSVYFNSSLALSWKGKHAFAKFPYLKDVCYFKKKMYICIYIHIIYIYIYMIYVYRSFRLHNV